MELLKKVLSVFVTVFLLSSPSKGGVISSGVDRPEGVKTAPLFILKDLEGGVKGLNDFKGHLILLHFWATWCVPCKDELLTIKALWERLKDKGFVVVAIATDSKRAVGPFVKKHDLSFPVLIDQYGGAMRAYSVRMLPTSYIVNKEGKIVGIAIGPRDWVSPEMIGLVEGLLKE